MNWGNVIQKSGTSLRKRETPSEPTASTRLPFGGRSSIERLLDLSIVRGGQFGETQNRGAQRVNELLLLGVERTCAQRLHQRQ